MIAESDKECFDILAGYEDFDDRYNDRIMTNVTSASRFQLASDENSRIVDVFIT